MAGERNLDNLLRYMSPELKAGEYVFCSLEQSSYGDFADAKPIACFTEDEGLSLVVLRKDAERLDLPYETFLRCISLRIHSSLEAVGLTAAIAGDLAAQGIAANIIAAHFHDHVFVPADMAERALGILSSYSDT